MYMYVHFTNVYVSVDVCCVDSSQLVFRESPLGLIVVFETTQIPGIICLCTTSVFICGWKSDTIRPYEIPVWTYQMGSILPTNTCGLSELQLSETSK